MPQSYKLLLSVLLVLLVPCLGWAQGQGAGTSNEPLYQMTVVSKTVKAINYPVLGGSSKVDMVGTALMPNAKGDAKVESKPGGTSIQLEIEGMGSPMQFGAEYLTYVLWSISPEGQTKNLGEVLLDDKGKGKLTATTTMQVFALVITAEPYFAVRQPSDLVVVDNELRKNTKGKVFIVDAKADLLKRGQYQRMPNPLALTIDLKKYPLSLYEARNALYIAKSFGAPKYAPDVYSRAEASLQMADNAVNAKQSMDKVTTTARQAVQFAEDARILAQQREKEEALAQERAAAAEREAQAKAAAEAAKLKAQQEAEQRAQAIAAQKEAEKQKALAEQQKAQADKERLEAELQAAKAAAQKAEADTAKLKAQEAEAAALAAKEKALKAAQEAEQQKAELRAKLLQQFNAILPTTDTDKGLVVNMGDVLFATGKYDLRDEAKLKLARLAGIVLAYPGLKLQAQGYTDNTGGEALNQKLSEQRAGAVKDFLVSQGLSDSNVTATGFGMADPVASNDTAAGRQKNRRVEIVISGEVIGTKL
jgi:outer membrane protein OmpA-like peptidoglycan-associated protein